MSDEDTQPRLEMPDHTRVQLAAVVQAVIAVAVAFGVDISDEQSVALIALSGVLGTVLIGADAAIRRERARNADKLRPQAELVRTETPAGTEVETRLTAPIGELEGGEAQVGEAIVELVRRIVSEGAEELPARSRRARNR